MTARQLSQFLLAALVGGGITAALLLLAERTETTADGTPASVRESGTVTASATVGERLTAAEIYERALPGIVAVRARSVQPVASAMFDAGESPEAGISTGSGFVLDEDGHVVTSAQVVSGVTDVQVTFADLQTRPARVVGKDEQTDLAMLAVDPGGIDLQPLELGDSDAIQVGDRAVAVGNPSGLEPTAGTGVVASRGERIETATGVFVDGVVRTDAVIVPGSAGGPLLGPDGRVIGISSREAGESATGVAVPVDTAKEVLAQLRERHKLIRPYLGIRGRTADPPATGAVLESVYPGGPAAQVGLGPGDVVEAVDGRPVGTIDTLLDEVERRRPGERMQLTVVRDGNRSVVEVTIAERPATLPSG